MIDQNWDQLGDQPASRNDTVDQHLNALSLFLLHGRVVAELLQRRIPHNTIMRTLDQKKGT